MLLSVPGDTRRRVPRVVAAVAIPVLAAGLAFTAPLAAQAAPAPAVPTFQDGLSQAVFTKTSSQWIRQEVWVQSEVDSDNDGKDDLVHIDVTRVPETNTDGLKTPVIMEMSPYYAGGPDVPNWSVDHEIGEPPTSKPGWPAFTPKKTSPKISSTFESTWVPRGFTVVHAESLGSGFSEGCPTSGDVNESLGGKAVIDWLNGRTKGFTSVDRSTEVSASWSTGSVGMIGTSYNGTLPIGVASTGVDGLDAIVPISAISSWYNYYRANGAVRAPGGYQGEDLDVLADYVHTRADQAICQPVIDDIRAREDRATGDDNAFWQQRDYLANADKIKAATLVAHGLNDWNVMTKNASDLYEALKKNNVPHQIYLHQGGHGGSPNDTLLNRWFTRYLYNVQNGVENLNKAYIQREDRTLVEYPEWPDAGAAKVSLNLGAATAANAVGELDFKHAASGVTETVVDNATIKAQTLAAAATSPNRLVYQTRALTDTVRLSGTPSVSLNVAVDREKANLTALLVEYPATGAPKIITRGWMDVENRNSAKVTDPIEPGTSYQFNFDFEPKDYIFNVGSRIGVVVMSSDNEYTVRPAPGTQLTIDPSLSSVSLPLVGGAQGLQEALAPGAPGTDYQVISATLSGSPLSLTVSSTDPITLPAVTLTGVDQVTAGELHPVQVVDSRGTSAGWDLTGQVSDFTSGTGTILADNLGWRPTAETYVGTLPVAPGESSTVTAGETVEPGSGLGEASTLCASAAGASSGSFTCAGGLDLGIPGASRLGTYTGILTLTLI
ncbi:Xaa-Pro dipeptidyl-peptidase [Compostimonas suwonensis]|uniref:Xaa-Pro dipeptidyl-peptidase n=1 Tax=Compostimonas suwonensis TaxID=1048394 RepID=A0A2M9BZ11_9MICO|nr:Xaa-Pro dipeptidyl-peptidase [Compostimonas suwonensis]PJJ63315.1 X-Pro dipeptidyl-peptidase [Compostimonas suwonensis]